MESPSSWQELNGEKRLTIVQYDITSSEDEMPDDRSYVYCSREKVSPPRLDEREDLDENGERNSPVSCESSQDDEPDSKKARVEFYELSSETSAGHSSHAESSGPEDIQAQEISAPRQAVQITISSSSGEEENEDDGDEGEGEGLQPAVLSRKAYALPRTSLPPDLARYLSDVRSFFTRPHSLQRHGQHLATSTYMKAEERILCEYLSVLFFCFITICPLNQHSLKLVS